MNSNQRLIEASKRGYRIENGRPVSPSGKILSMNKNKEGYYRFSFLDSDGDVRSIVVHRMVAFQKYGNELFNPGVEVRHLNGIKEDNSVDNILIGSKSDNEMDKPEEKRRNVARNAAKKLSEGEVTQLRMDRAAGMKYEELSQKYGIRKSTISYIVRGMTY